MAEEVIQDTHEHVWELSSSMIESESYKEDNGRGIYVVMPVVCTICKAEATAGGFLEDIEE